MKSFIADKPRKLSKSALDNLQDLTYTAFMRSLRKKDIKVNGKRVKDDLMLKEGDLVEVFYQPQQDLGYTVVYKDQNVLVVNKKQGVLSETVFENIKAEFNEARFIHRLDRNTRGIMIFALNEKSEQPLLDGFKDRTFDKKYHALVKGVPKKAQDELTAYLVKDKDAATVKIYANKVAGCVQIKTGYKILEKYSDSSLLEVNLLTGKTHQIRAHLAFIGCPIVGDGKYGDFEFNKEKNLKMQELTAKSLTLKFKEGSYLSYLNGKTFTV